MAELALKPTDLKAALKFLLAAGLNPYIHGDPGIGKSEIVAEVAREMGYRLLDLRLVTLDPVDLRGLPTVTNGQTKWAQAAFLPTVNDPKTMVFFDELNRAPTLTQNAALQITLPPHQLGEYQAPPGTLFIAAGNVDGAGVQRLIPPLSTRFQHLVLEPDLDDSCLWANANDLDPLIVGFWRWRPELLNKYDKNARAWPNPRSWKFASDVSKQGPSKTVERALYAGIVGEGATIEYLAYAELYRQLPSIDAILLNPMAAPVPTNTGTLYAVSAAIAARATERNFDRVMTYLQRLPREFMVYAIRDCTTRDTALASTDVFNRWAVASSDLI